MAERSRDLTLLAGYNAWANQKLFALARSADPEKLARKDGYESIAEILRHLVHVESNFWLMSLGRERVPVDHTDFDRLAARCTEVDAGYERLAETSDRATLEREFLVPWFGFKVTVREAMLQAFTHSQSTAPTSACCCRSSASRSPVWISFSGSPSHDRKSSEA